MISRDEGPTWPVTATRSATIDEGGLLLDLGTTLMRFVENGRDLAIEADRERALALLSIVKRHPVDEAALVSIETAAHHWRRGDKALANLRLVFADLPRLREPMDAYRLAAAEYLLDQGMTPSALLKELGLPPVRPLAKYNPDQPRVPAGHGTESGRWAEADGSYGLLPPITLGIASRAPAHGIEIAANGDLRPGGQIVVPLPEEDPLDPKQLNRLLPPQEEQAIADTLNVISGGTAEDVKALQPHSYRNLPHRDTGALLPPSLGGYTAYSMIGAGRGSARGSPRIIVDQATGSSYYTNTHYKSFYPIVLTPKK